MNERTWEPWNRRLRGILKFSLLSTAALLLISCSDLHRQPPQQPPADPPTVDVVRVTRQDLAQTLTLAAEFRPFQEIDVDAKEAGYVKQIYVDYGSRVNEGQLLAVLEIPELQDQVAQAEASYKQSQDEIQHAQFEIRQAEAVYQATHLDYTRLSDVSKTQPNLVAQQEIDDALAKDQAAAAQVDAAKAALAAAQQHLLAAQANQERVRALYAYSRITAPFSGVVTKRYADTGSMLQAGTSSYTQAMPLVRLSQNDLLRLTIYVPEASVPLVHLGMSAQVHVPALGKTYQGKVARFADKIDLNTRTMHTEVDVPNPTLELVPGMYAYVSLVLQARKNVLAVPVLAIDRQGNQASVLAVNARRRIELAPVQLGLETPNRVEVLSGLHQNDMVVTSQRGQLQPGEPVQPRQQARNAVAGGL